MEQYSHPEFKNMIKENLNSQCFDCEKLNPEWASLNNSIFVCLSCAGIHRNFGVYISYIKSLTIDAWEEKEIQLLKIGGNKRFRDFLDGYQVPKNAVFDYKYMIRASDYYRRKLKAELKMEKFEEDQPDLVSGLEMMDFSVNQSIYIDNSKLICSKNNEHNNQEEIKQQGCFEKFTGMLCYTTDKVRNLSNISIKQKVYETGQGTISVLKYYGSNLVETGKEIYNSNKLGEIFNKTDEKLNYLVERTKSMIWGENQSTGEYSKVKNEENFFKVKKKSEIINIDKANNSNSVILDDSNFPNVAKTEDKDLQGFIELDDKYANEPKLILFDNLTEEENNNQNYNNIDKNSYEMFDYENIELDEIKN